MLHFCTFRFVGFAAVCLASRLGAAVPAMAGTWTFDPDTPESLAHPAANPTTVFHGGTEPAPGIAGSCRLFDGICGFASCPAPALPAPATGFTVQAWIALGAYPWTEAPVLDTGSFALGLDALGRPTFALTTAAGPVRLVGEVSIPLGRWHHLAGVADPQSGLTLYLDGVPVGTAPGAFTPAPVPAGEWLIGRSRLPVRATGAIRPDSSAAVYSFLDGALDSLELLPRAVPATELAVGLPPAARPDAPLPPRVLPSGPAGPGPFGAFYTQLAFYPQWDRAWRTGPTADVVVRFDSFPGRFVFWRGTSYIPHWVTENGLWYTNEFNETWGDVRGCGEPMSDKQCRYSRVAVIESGEARAVVHWRYALTDVFYEIARTDPATGWGDWTDEVHTIYPDGTAVREITLHSSAPDAPHEWHEGIVVMGPGITPERALEPGGLTVLDPAGQGITFDWSGPDLPWSPGRPAQPCVYLVNTRSRYRPFSLVRPQDRPTFNLFAKEIRRDVSMYPWWNHWPAAGSACDGRFAFAADRPSHASLHNIAWEPAATGRDSITKIMLTGLTDQPAAALVPLLHAWANPPALTVVAGPASARGFNPAQKAFVLDATGAAAALTLRLATSAESPLARPAFVIKNWGQLPARVLLDGRPLHRGTDYRAQLNPGLGGTDLVLWLDHRGTAPVQLVLEPAVP